MSEYENGEPQVDNPEKEETLEELSITPKEWKFTMGGKKYCAKELYGPQRDRYLNQQQDNLRVDPKSGRVLGLKTFEDHMVPLLAMGLYCEDESGAFTKQMGESFCRNLPASTQKRIYEKLQKMSALELGNDEDSGNS